VERPRLHQRLNRAAESKLSLVSAPAGFGKTTLVAAWLLADPQRERSVPWLSLDESDNDPTSFWTYVIGALQRAAPGDGAGALSVLQSSQPSIDVVMATLVKRAQCSADEVVLDDYHVIDAREINDGMGVPGCHLPPQLDQVVASRADPPLPLARLRARGELVETRAADLRFTSDEAAAYLTDVLLDVGGTLWSDHVP
jgi:LuxR family transcriptional regulator, maltose regulon positive regulatory protein